MKKVLAATIAFALVDGTAFADVTISGDAKFGIEYNFAPTDENGSLANKSRLMFTREIGVDFIGSGTTDGGLSFGAKVGFDTFDGTADTGTVFVSGAFGTITFGHDDAADALAGGIADVGLNGLGVDDVVEDIRGTTAPQARYDVSAGNFAFAISAGTREPRRATAGYLIHPVTLRRTYGQLEVKKNSYAVGGSFSASGVTVGVGYDSEKAVSGGIGYSTDQFSAKALWAKRDQPYFNFGTGWHPGGTGGSTDTTHYAYYSGRGIEASYTTGASTFTMVHARTKVDNIQPVFFAVVTYFKNDVTFEGTGVGFSHDLGGGASLVAGFAKVSKKTVKDLTWREIAQAPTHARREDLRPFTDIKSVASAGLSFSF